MKHLVNGRSASSIPTDDRGLAYGDGLFETIKVLNGKPLFWERHLQRLKEGCNRLEIPFIPEKLLEKESTLLLDGTDNAVLKIIVTRGSGGRGYQFPEQVQPRRIISLFPAASYPADYYSEGIEIGICQTRLGANRALAGIKHLNRLEQVLARNELTDSGYSEGVMLDHSCFPIEGCMSNLFWVTGQTLYTPSLEESGVKGIARSVILDLANRKGIPLKIGRFELEHLMNADEVFLTNSVIDVWPIRKIRDQIYNVGPVTQQLMSLYSSELQREAG